MEVVSVSLKSLHENFNGKINHGTIEKSESNEEVYYDLFVNGVLSCLDGEECEVKERENGVVTLVNREGEIDTQFTLTDEEFSIACYN